MTIMLLNDTGNFPHVGCLAVSNAHNNFFTKNNIEVRYRYFVDQLSDVWAGDRESTRISIIRSPIYEELSKVDCVVLNGEGTIHHGSGLQLLAILSLAQEMDKKTYLINALIQECPMYHDTLAMLSFFSVRDYKTSEYLSMLNIKHQINPDSIIYANFSGIPNIDYTNKIVVMDCHWSRHDVLEILNKVKEHFKMEAVYYPLESNNRTADWQHAVANIKKAKLVVTGRHHGVYIAILAETPFIALPSNSWKIEGTLQPFLIQNSVFCSESKFDEIISMCEYAMENPDMYKEIFEHYSKLKYHPLFPLSNDTILMKIKNKIKELLV